MSLHSGHGHVHSQIEKTSLAGYYARYTPKYSDLTRPLILIKMPGLFQWTEPHQHGFTQGKAAFCGGPCLHFNFSLHLCCRLTYMSRGLGAVLSQVVVEEHPVVYISHKPSLREK